jgi:LacI family transcriptional regulator
LVAWKRFHRHNSAQQLLLGGRTLGAGGEVVRLAAAATIRDVARRAGVSMATVSRALNGHPSVTVETRARVQSAAAELHFTPSGAARSLITRRTQTVAALLPELHGEVLSELIRGIEVAARAQGLHLLVSSLSAAPGQAAEALRSLAGRIDGLILMPPPGSAPDVLPPSARAVLIESAAADSPWPSFQVDHRGGAAAMARHLRAQGHDRLAYIAGPATDFGAAERLRGWLDTAPDAAVLQGDGSERSGHAAGRAIAAMADRPSAVFAGNDMMAVGCLAAFAEAGLDVPRDIALAGFDDIPMARYLRPALTTVRMPIAELGALALRRLADDIAAGDVPAVPSRHTVATEVVVRASCARAPRQ